MFDTVSCESLENSTAATFPPSSGQQHPPNNSSLSSAIRSSQGEDSIGGAPAAADECAALRKQLEVLRQQHSVLVYRLKQTEQGIEMLSNGVGDTVRTAEREEEHMTNIIHRKIESLEKEKLTLAQHLAKEEKTKGALEVKLAQTKKENASLQQQLQHEEEMITSKLKKQLEEVERHHAELQQRLQAEVTEDAEQSLLRMVEHIESARENGVLRASVEVSSDSPCLALSARAAQCPSSSGGTPAQPESATMDHKVKGMSVFSTCATTTPLRTASLELAPSETSTPSPSANVRSRSSTPLAIDTSMVAELRRHLARLLKMQEETKETTARYQKSSAKLKSQVEEAQKQLTAKRLELDKSRQDLQQVRSETHELSATAEVLSEYVFDREHLFHRPSSAACSDSSTPRERPVQLPSCASSDAKPVPPTPVDFSPHVLHRTPPHSAAHDGLPPVQLPPAKSVE